MKMMQLKRIKAGVLLFVVFVAAAFFISPLAAYGDSLNYSGESTDIPIKLTTQGASFSATVPTVIPFCANTDGTVLTTGCLKLINRSHGQIAVKKMVVELPEDWEYSSAAGTKADKTIRLNIQGKDIPKDGDADLSKFEAIDGGENLSICLNACCDGAKNEGGTITQARVTIILGWNKLSEI